MNRVFFFSFIFIVGISICSCGNPNKSRVDDIETIIPPPPPPPPPNPNDTSDKSGYRCVFEDRLNAQERRSLYPFSEANSVQIVSFFPIPDSIYVINEGLPIKNRKLDIQDFREIIKLKGSQIDTLTNILYNYRSAAHYQVEVHLASNWISENAILFINDDNKCFAYIELCFKDSDYDYYPDSLNLGNFCDYKLDLIEQLFKDNGIKNGVEFNK